MTNPEPSNLAMQPVQQEAEPVISLTKNTRVVTSVATLLGIVIAVGGAMGFVYHVEMELVRIQSDTDTKLLQMKHDQSTEFTKINNRLDNIERTLEENRKATTTAFERASHDRITMTEFRSWLEQTKALNRGKDVEFAEINQQLITRRKR